MKLQNILFPFAGICMEEGMYFRREGHVKFYGCAHYIRVRKNGKIHFDTYFNGFSAEKWFKYTNVQKISITLKIKGNVRIVLMRKETVGTNVEIDFLHEEIFESEEVTEHTFEYSTFSTNGMYCFSIIGERGESEFFGGYYSAEIPDKKIRKVKIAVDICTFKRERFIEGNLEILKKRFLENPGSELFDSLEIYVSDNAGTLDKEKISTEKIHVFKNKNTGGAGGFTRGLIEINAVKKEQKITHVLLMDDDVLIEPESIFRTFNILTCVKEKYYDAFIGGAMLRLDHKNIQVESGAVWEEGNIISLKAGLNLIDCAECLFNEIEENAQFNAWWYCAFPVDIVNDNNLPLPIFIRGDDVEYGLRNMKYLILMNGICVWHEPFEKKCSSFLFYYIWRNRLINNSLHKIAVSKQQVIKLLKVQVIEQVRLYRYKNANLLLRGTEDFLRGVNWLMQQDGAALHEKIVNEGYQLQYIEDLEETITFFFPMYADSINAQNPNTFKYHIIDKYTINGNFFLPTSNLRPYNIVPVEGAKNISIYRTKKVLNYDYSSRKGFLTYKKSDEAKEVLGRLKQVCKRLMKEYDIVVKDFEENGNILMSKEFWKTYLDL